MTCDCTFDKIDAILDRPVMGKIIFTIFEVLPLVQQVVPVQSTTMMGEKNVNPNHEWWVAAEARLTIEEPGNNGFAAFLLLSHANYTQSEFQFARQSYNRFSAGERSSLSRFFVINVSIYSTGLEGRPFVARGKLHCINSYELKRARWVV